MGSPPATKRRRTDGDRCSSDDAVLEGSDAVLALAARCAATPGAPAAAELFAHLAAALSETAPPPPDADAYRAALVAVARAGAAARAAAGRHRAAVCMIDGAYLRCRDASERRRLSGEAEALHGAALAEAAVEAPDAWPDASLDAAAPAEGLARVRRTADAADAVARAAPAVLEGAVGHWPALAAWRSPRALVAAAGARLVPVEVGANHGGGAGGRAQQRLVSLGDYVAAVLLPAARGDAPTLGPLEAPVAVSEVVPVTSAATPAYLAQHDLLAQCRALAAAAPWRATFGDVLRAGPRARAGLEPVVSAWVAPRGVSTPLHFDRHPNLLVHLVGAKRVRLWPPGAGLPRHAAPADNTSPLDARDVPGALAADLAPGDVLFVPEGWWHFVETPRTSISISIWY